MLTFSKSVKTLGSWSFYGVPWRFHEVPWVSMEIYTIVSLLNMSIFQWIQFYNWIKLQNWPLYLWESNHRRIFNFEIGPCMFMRHWSVAKCEYCIPNVQYREPVHQKTKFAPGFANPAPIWDSLNLTRWLPISQMDFFFANLMFGAYILNQFAIFWGEFWINYTLESAIKHTMGIFFSAKY